MAQAREPEKPSIPGSFAIEAFEPSSTTWKRWLQRLQGAFLIFGIKDNARVPYLLHYVGASAFDVLCDRLDPVDPFIQPYDVIVQKLEEFYEPAPLEIAENYRYYQRKQSEGESVQQFVAALHKLSIHCKFGDYLKTALRNQFVFGLLNKKAQARLLEKKDVDFDEAVKIAITMELSEKSSQQMKSASSNLTGIDYLKAGKKPPRKNTDNLLKAKSKASIAEDTSDLASDRDGITIKRIRKKEKNLYSSTDEIQSAFSSESSDDEVAAPIKFSAIHNHTEIKANINKNAEPSTSKSNVIETSMCTDSKPLTSKNKQSIIITKDIENIIEPIKSNNIKKKLLPEGTIGKTVHCNERDTTSNNDQSDNRDIEFKKQVLRQLQIINLKQTQMWEDIQTIMSKIVMQDDKILTKNDKESIFNKFTFPLKSISELDAVEEFLSDEYNYGLLVQELTKIGGLNYKHTIKRIMFKLFSNEVAEGYSWIGFKGKNKFSLLRISAAIIMAVQKTHSTITLCDIEAVIKVWLVKAKFRNTKKTT